MASIFADFGLQIEFNVTAQSLIIAYSIGVVLTFLTVTFSSWRVGNLNIVSAIRDSAEPIKTKEKPSGSVVRYLLWVMFKPDSWRQFFVAVGMIVLGIVLFAAGIGLFIGAAQVYSDTAVGGSLGVLLGVIGGLVIAAGAALLLIGFSSIFQLGPLMLIAGPLLVLWGLSAQQAFPFGLGVSLFIVGAALLIRFIGAPARPVFTVMGLTMLILWLLLAGQNIPGTEELSGDIEMFFLSGVTMVLAGTFVLVYNADLLLAALNFVGRFVSSLVPSIRTAVAYPLANKFRTGMTVAMISLVMFALVMFSTMNSNFDRIFLSDDALAGYDVAVEENPGNPIADLVAELNEKGFGQESESVTTAGGGDEGGAGGGDEGGASGTDAIAGVDRLAEANPQVSKFRQVPDGDIVDYDVLGMSPEFIANNELTFQARATGYASDQEIRDALAENPDFAIIDAFALGGDFGGEGSLGGIEPTDTTFEPVTVEVRDSATRQSAEVTIIGVIGIAGSGLFDGLFVSQEVFDEVYNRPISTTHLVRLVDGADATDVARGIERTLLAEGVQAESLRDVLDEYQAQSRGFLYLFQAFMGIGLFVGIAAVGVIAFRTVVERRQQIGMLRAIGYSRGAIGLSFLMESSFTALLGIASGITLGLLLAQQLVQTDDFVAGGVTSFYIPWVQILAIGGFAFIASLLMTIIPSRQASSIPIAEALRYE
jgi:putative ABC transport system permease protein